LEKPIVLFDLEYTAWEGSAARKWAEPWEHREIIQIAAIELMTGEGIRETRCFDCYVRPKVNPDLSDYIVALTGIEQSDIDFQGIPFPKALARLATFCAEGHIPLYCYGDDVSVLLENCTLNEVKPMPLDAGIHDIRAVLEQAGIDTRAYTSGTVHQAAGIKFKPAAHNALNDVRSVAATLEHLLKTGKIGQDWPQQGQKNRFGWPT
jgi:inhibitor of KinA sporulation pathway (predicted exonuclease)